MFCLSDERSTIRRVSSGDWIYISLGISWLLLVILSTVLYESRYIRGRPSSELSLGESDMKESDHISRRVGPALRSRRKTLEAFIEALSIRVSWTKFISYQMQVDYKQSKGVRVDLGVLNMFKVIMILTVVCAHNGWQILNYTRYLPARIDGATSLAVLLISSIATRFIDTFLVVFGLFRAHTFLKRVNQQQIGNTLVWIKFI